ncbi:MAG: arginine repressor [Bacillota bacterium]|nr:arginine repressor [Bacillota bacterium]REJ35514.1 MAG: arginine repressor [Bacillota bacterium]
MKEQRQQAILRLIEEYPIETQAELLERLRAEGFVATQATVSRDIAELGLVKVRGASGKSYYTRPPQPPASEVLERTRWALREYVVGIEFSGRLVLLKTLSGRAHAVAAAIDEYNPPGVLGTLAGDDSVLILVRPREPEPPAPEVQEVLRLLQELRGS